MSSTQVMLSDENNFFEIEESYAEFHELCTQLKNQAFPSPWSIFFKNSDTNDFVTEVSEFVVDDTDLLSDNNEDAPLHPNTPSTVFEKNYPPDTPFNKKKICKLRESLITAQDDSTVGYVKDFDIFFTVPSSQISELCEMLDIFSLNDVALNLFLNTILHFKDQISITTAVILVHHVISPLIFDIKKNSSRFLLTSILKFSEVYPKAIVDEVLIPFSKKDTTEDLQSDIITQITKTNLPNDYVFYAIKRVLQHALPVDNTFAVLKNLIERKVYHENILCDLLLNKLLGWTSVCNKNVKFTKLLTSILSAYGNEFSEEQISMCDNVIKSNKTIIKRAAENLLKRLKAEREM